MEAYTPELLKSAHRHSSNHRAEIEASDICGCFYCCSNFAPADIEDWIPEGEGTAHCPKCSIDSVIGSASGYPAGDPAFLGAMHTLRFGTVRPKP